MELRQLKYFVTIAETLNFSEAAREVCITQGTLSQQIKQLEQELDTQLLIRNSHSVMLTEAGETLLPYARRTLRDAEMCVDQMQDLKELLTGTLNIGVTYSFGPILSESLCDFVKQYPKVKLNIFSKPMEEQMEMLRHRAVDFVLAYKPSTPMVGIESHVLFQSNLSVIVDENHTLAAKDSVSIGELSRYDLALPSKGLQARNAFELAMHDDLSCLKIHLELNDANMLLKLVNSGHFVTVLAEASIYNKAGLKAVPLDLPSTEMIGCVHTLKDSYRKRSMLEFIRLLGDSVAVRQRAASWL